MNYISNYFKIKENEIYYNTTKNTLLIKNILINKIIYKNNNKQIVIKIMNDFSIKYYKKDNDYSYKINNIHYLKSDEIIQKTIFLYNKIILFLNNRFKLLSLLSKNKKYIILLDIKYNKKIKKSVNNKIYYFVYFINYKLNNLKTIFKYNYFYYNYYIYIQNILCINNSIKYDYNIKFNYKINLIYI